MTAQQPQEHRDHECVCQFYLGAQKEEREKGKPCSGRYRRETCRCPSDTRSRGPIPQPAEQEYELIGTIFEPNDTGGNAAIPIIAKLPKEPE